MPGFMLHLAEGQMILDKLNKLNKPKYIDSDYIHGFMCGCMIPDATSDKELTHFRPLWQKELITKYPDMNYIINTYIDTLSTACDLGILAHLHLDSLYVSSYWKQHFIFEDEYGNETAIHKDIYHVRLLKDNSHIPYSEFFSDKYFYGDYDILNPYIYRTVHPYIPNVYDVPPEQIHINECKNYDAALLEDCIQNYVLSDTVTNGTHAISNESVCIHTKKYSLQKQSAIPETRIFPYDSILAFLDNTSNEFIKLITERGLLQ